MKTVQSRIPSGAVPEESSIRSEARLVPMSRANRDTIGDSRLLSEVAILTTKYENMWNEGGVSVLFPYECCDSHNRLDRRAGNRVFIINTESDFCVSNIISYPRGMTETFLLQVYGGICLDLDVRMQSAFIEELSNGYS